MLIQQALPAGLLGPSLGNKEAESGRISIIIELEPSSAQREIGHYEAGPGGMNQLRPGWLGTSTEGS